MKNEERTAIVHFAGAGFLRTSPDPAGAAFTQLLSLFPRSGPFMGTMLHRTRLTFSSRNVLHLPADLPAPATAPTGEPIVVVELNDSARVEVEGDPGSLEESSDPDQQLDNMIQAHRHIKGLMPFSSGIYAAGVQLRSGIVASHDRLRGDWGTFGKNGRKAPNDRVRVSLGCEELRITIRSPYRAEPWLIRLGWTAPADEGSTSKAEPVQLSVTNFPVSWPTDGKIHYGVLDTAENPDGNLSKISWPHPSSRLAETSENHTDARPFRVTYPATACPYAWFSDSAPDESF